MCLKQIHKGPVWSKCSNPGYTSFLVTLFPSTAPPTFSASIVHILPIFDSFLITCFPFSAVRLLVFSHPSFKLHLLNVLFSTCLHIIIPLPTSRFPLNQQLMLQEPPLQSESVFRPVLKPSGSPPLKPSPDWTGAFSSPCLLCIGVAKYVCVC